MALSDVIGQILSEKGLRWVESERRGPLAFFGMSSRDQLDPKLFTYGDGLPRIPEDIGDAFKYQIKTPELVVSFQQQHMNSIPLSTIQFLSFHYSEGNATEEWFSFEFGDYYGGGKYIEFTPLPGKHIPLQWNYREELIQEDRKFMEALIKNKENIMQIPGLRPEDSSLLRGKLNLIKQKYRMVKEEPRAY